MATASTTTAPERLTTIASYLKEKRKNEGRSGRKRPRKVDIEDIPKKILKKNFTIDPEEWLSDLHINMVLKKLHKKFPKVAGLIDPVVLQKQLPDNKKLTGNFLQILHVNSNHWVCIQRENGHIRLYDSSNKLTSKDTLNTIARFLRSPEKSIHIEVMNVQQQSNWFDCGVYAIAFTISLLHSKSPVFFNYLDVRGNFIKLINTNNVISFDTQIASRKVEVLRIVKVDLYCSCRGIFIKDIEDKLYSDMTECENCLEWFHDNCIELVMCNTIKLCKTCKK